MDPTLRHVITLIQSRNNVECYPDTFVRSRKKNCAWTMESGVGTLHSLWDIYELGMRHNGSVSVGVDKNTGEVYEILETNPFGFTFDWKKDLYDSFGKICELDKNGNLVVKYDDIDAAAEKTFHKKDSIFIFEKFLERGDRITKLGVDFFGCKLRSQYFDQSSVDSYPIRWLNEVIAQEKKDIKEKYGGIERYRILRRYNPEHFKWDHCMGVYRFTIRNNRLQERKENFSEDKYQENINNLLQLYSVDNQCLFRKVERLSDYDVPGIYVITVDKIGGIYVGQSKSSIKKRILQHFKKSSDTGIMDPVIGSIDVSQVYALPLNGNIRNFSRIEADCICAIDAEYSLNTQMPTSYGCFTTNMFSDGYDVDPLMVERSERFMLSPEERKELYAALSR